MALPATRAQDMAAFFTGMPDEHIPQLEDAWRKDLVDLYRAGKPATLENTMKGHSTLLKLTDDYMLLQTTERSTLEVKFLPLVNQTYVVCAVTTVCAPVADSRIAFYTTDWKPLDVSALWSPPAGEWYIRRDANRQDEAFPEAVSYLDMHLIHYRLSADSQTLTAEYVTPQYLSAEERAKVEPFLTDAPKVYQWRTGRFEE
jgi:hypothetical protein